MSTRFRSHVLWQPSAAEPISARVAVAGDFLPSGRLTVPPSHTWKSMAMPIAPVFDDIDVGIANLEAVLDSSGLAPRSLNGLGDIVSAPDASLDYLAALRLQILSVANNHSFDFGPAGLARTLAAVTSRGLKPLGAGRTLRDSPDVFLWQGPENLRVGFWAAAKATRDPATRCFAGVEPATLVRGAKALNALRSDGAQFCIALLHAGCLRTSHPDPEDVRLLDSLAAAGFDIVAASHSHRISGTRQVLSSRHPAFCFYGLGSLVSGYVSSTVEAEGSLVVASLTSQGNLARLEVRPILLGSTGWAAIPTAEDAGLILEHLESFSRQIFDGSFAASFYRDMSESMFGVYWRDTRAAFRESGFTGLLRKTGRLRLRHIKRLVRAAIR